MGRIFIYSSQQNMKNKNLSLKWVLMVAAVGFLSFWFCSATTNFHFNIEAVKAIQESLQDDIMPIHFADNWNDFWGFFYFSNGLGNEAEWGAKAPDKTFHKCITGEELEPTITCVETEDECEGTFEPEATAYDSDCSEEVPAPTQDPEIEEYQYKVSIPNPSKPNWEEKYVCSRQVKWYYYNAERWEKLWPLDGDTWSDMVETTWWFYTMCKKEWYVEALSGCLRAANSQHITTPVNYYDCKDQARKDYATDGDWYYGSIKHVYSWQDMELIAWVKYDPETKFTSIVQTGGFSPSFIRLGNKYPLWFIYDYNGGVWFVWCKMGTVDSMKNLIRAYNARIETNKLEQLFRDLNGTVEYRGWWDVSMTCSGLVWDSLIWVVIEWIVWMWEVWNTANFEVIWNQRDKKMQYFSSANINNNTIINYARKKAELLCRWKWNHYNSNDKIICVDQQNVNWNLNGPSNNINWKTLIVKNWDVTITPSSSDDNKYYDIFIDSWNLIIDETDSTKKFVIMDNGFVSTTTSPSQFNSNVLIDRLKDTNASETKIGECINHINTLSGTTANSGVCMDFKLRVQIENDSGEVIEEYWKLNDYTWCINSLINLDPGPCLSTWWLDITMDPNGDWQINGEDITFLHNCSSDETCSVWNDVAIASIIKWNFIVDGKVLGPDRPSDASFDKKLKNKYFIYWKLSSRDSFQTLQDTFAWRCNNWYTTDDSYCLPSNTGYSNPYEDAFLVVIDQNYENSPFFNASK